MNGSKYPVTVHLPVKYLGVDVLARLAEAEQADALRVEIRQLKSSRARLIVTQETMAERAEAERNHAHQQQFQQAVSNAAMAVSD